MVVTMEDKFLAKTKMVMWQKSLSKKFKQKLVCHLRNKYLWNKIDHTEVAVLESSYFQYCILNANKY